MDQYRKKSELFDNGNVLLIPLGDDFRYQTENEWKVQFDNYKKLMNHINNKKVWNMEIKFATLSEYFEAFDNDKKKHLPTLTGNMFSYSDRLDHYWTGYFTSRPMLKSLDRILMSGLRTAEIAFSLALIYQQKYGVKSSNVFNVSKVKDDIRIARRTLSLFQHHDAIAGTCTRHVVEDYGNKLIDAIHISQDVFLKSAQRILEKNVENTQLDSMMFDLDELIKSYGQEKEINYVDLVVIKQRYIYLFNSLSQPRQVVVHIPIKNNIRRGIKIMGSGNQIMKCQLSPSTLNKGYNEELHYVSFKLNIGPLAFEQVQIIVSEDIYSGENCAPVEIHFYNMKDSLDSKIAYKVIKHTSDKNKFVIIDNLVNTLYISTLTGTIEKIKGYYSGNTHEFKVRFKKYGVKKAKEQSGAYIFLPDGNGQILKSEESPLLTHFKGNVVEEVHINHKYVTQMIKIYRVDGSLANAIDIENIIDIRETNNFELSMALMTASVVPSDIFYTDSNCFQVIFNNNVSKITVVLKFIKRKTLLKFPIQGNVYPMSCGSFVQSNTVNDIYRMSLFSKQANGVMGGKIAFENKTYAFLEVFQDRKLDQDDNRGLFESVIDNVVTPVKYRIVFEGWKSTSSMPHNEELTVASYQLLNDLTYPIHQLHIKPDLNNKVSDNLISQKSMLTGLGLSCDYHMVNLRTEDNDLPKLTLHRLKLNCDAKFISKGSCNVSRRKSVLFKSIFDDLSIKSVQKAHLTGTYLNTIGILPEDVKVNTMEMETFVLQFELK